MIKKNQNNTRQKLLRKNSGDSVSIYPPFEVQECYSAVDYNERDHSYYCLDNELVTNPYFIQMAQLQNKKPELKLQEKNDHRYIPQKINMNRNQYQRISTQPQKKAIQQIKAFCRACQTWQLIPRNSSKFVCYHCRTICRCVRKGEEKKEQTVQKDSRPQSPPKSQKNKLFICGGCSVKVSYQAGSSQYIKCSKCNTINMVPK